MGADGVTQPPLRLGLFGAEGRMGRAVAAAVAASPDLALAVAIDRESDPALAFDSCNVVVDFSLAGSTPALLERLASSSAALVSGTTGRSAAEETALDARAALAPVFWASNFSVGVAVLAWLVRRAAGALGSGWEAEVLELHHRGKADAPSGTALTLAEAVAAGQGLAWPAARAGVRDGHTGPRSPGQVGIAALRAGDVIGEHTVFLCGPAERLELTHRAADRRLFAEGALAVARWVAGQPAGRRGMPDFLASLGLDG